MAPTLQSILPQVQPQILSTRSLRRHGVCSTVSQYPRMVAHVAMQPAVPSAEQAGRCRTHQPVTLTQLHAYRSATDVKSTDRTLACVPRELGGLPRVSHGGHAKVDNLQYSLTV